MEAQQPSDDLRHYFYLLLRWSWLILLAVLISGFTAFIVSQRLDPIYEASATLLVNEAPGTSGTDFSAVQTSLRLAQTYAEMLVKKPVMNEVIENLNLTIDVQGLKEIVTVQVVRDTQLIDVVVEDTDPNRAAAIANEVCTVFAEQNQAMQEARYASTKESLKDTLDELQDQIDEVEVSILALGTTPEDKSEADRLETILAEYRQTYATTLQSYEQVRLSEAETISNVIQAEVADPPLEPVRPNIALNTVLAAVVGVMVAVGGIFLIEALDDSIRGSDDASSYLGLPVLSAIRKIKDDESLLVTARKPRAPASEDFRSLRTNIQFASVDYPLRTILVTSPTEGDGKTTIATNLSIILAQGHRKVTLVDADLRRPHVHRHMRISNRWGLTSLFMDEDIRLDNVLRKNESAGLSVVTSGKLPPNPAELLSSEKMAQIILAIQQQSDVIIFDSPPLTAVTDAAVLSKQVDGVLLVIQSGRTKIAAAQRAVNQLQRVNANILGIVLNGVGVGSYRYYYQHYNKYYISDYESEYPGPTGNE